MVPVIYHNPACGTSRNVLAMLRQSGAEPTIILYLETPPDRATLEDLMARAGLTPRALLRFRGTPAAEMGLDAPDVSDAAILDAMMTHPILINRPLVITAKGVALCRPSERVLDLLETPEIGPFTKEDGQVVIDAAGRRVR